MRRRRPFFFEIMERMFEELTKEFRPFEERRRLPSTFEDWFKDPFEEMIKRFEKETPKELKELIREEETPTGKIRKYGPFIYGFSYTHEPGKEPEFKEFGNIRLGPQGRIEPALRGEREPLTDVIEEKDSYEVVVELPGVCKEDIKLNATENSLEIRATNDRKFHKEISFDETINPESAKATYKHGVLSVRLEKKRRRGVPIHLE
ncbi:MAG: Hsp20/alpha crystallin family protein [Methanocellales archaeon]|nr:Hsp20/alpha crystallin family protein [Methanocellales archaeon]